MATNNNSKRTWMIIGGAVVLIFGGLFLAKKMEWIGKVEPTEVEFAKVSRSTIIEKVSASGKIQPEVEVKLSPDVSGEIVSLNVAEGDSVVAGQELLKIRPDNYVSLLARAEAQMNATKANMEQSKAVLAQSEARLSKAKIDYDRNAKLHKDKVISDADFDQFVSAYTVAKQDLEAAKANVNAANYNVKSSQATLKEAKTNLTKTTIYAPQSGIISKLNVELGERVVGTSQMAGTEMLRIANLNKMEVRVNVNENDITRVSIGDTVLIDVDAFSSSERKFKGVVYEIASSANSSGTASAVSNDAVTEFEVKIRVLRSSYADLIKGKLSYPLKPGMTASVEILTNRKENIATVPLSAVTTREIGAEVKEGEKKEDDGTNATNSNDALEAKKRKENTKEVVFVMEKGKAKMIQVKTGISDFENIEIVNGLKDGQEIIAGPYATVAKKLKEGDLVKKKDPKAAEKAADKK
ncbi:MULTISPECIES: efflux RND transporter periplasmic adaptor subunit [Aquirufa]|jgi:HlyD family secretion protein|uniref:HlyD family efflux transporter periplasmic adaptor subunit n=2 Tax=Aquirufa TaxID=2676247 RepID=A0A4Q9BGM4_9BACT|nr:efflux RND transporter periplasmic adaptor subunit [Aquirufa antheringensis]MCE4217975.1 HlyD family efflux transporter periplasmic adaptor subunit [Pseudarcicella sp. GAP-15]MCZ2484941.1 HlyD family efflux transporter periplasmic adaptor subunit [Aquirufa antheringensis]MCZ2489875.1 HlyD family efflux transporter periplasmic adaptor subunit [Aquirufa antheringensis]TBH75247.1 HlyD family efflux transporter periplasmic adaptor subunit [Aquirufa antheringensis]